MFYFGYNNFLSELVSGDCLLDSFTKIYCYISNTYSYFNKFVGRIKTAHSLYHFRTANTINMAKLSDYK
ncbi:hypothetical protein HDF22_005065 [Mucilaginibacter lappiensis]|uniref:Uncharacterized protein n=1 Tax=Mucilaginibacter lappiensis TaxID=354630 RepID=A0A841JIC9_9SPHI|nr:hypothetical protein [Mucilaginibacter lappiensis]